MRHTRGTYGLKRGVMKIHDDPDLDFQLNRIVTLGGGDEEDVLEAAWRIRDLADWKREFLRLAAAADDQGRTANAAAYYRAADFYMSPDDPDKEKAYDRSVELFRETAKDEFESGGIIEARVPYESGFLPAWRLPVREGVSRGTIVMHGGFDSCKEELYPIADSFRSLGFDTIQFEGPGQGESLYKGKLAMTPAWERPVARVLDHFAIEDVTLIGLSLGGYLAPRAAAFERRVKRVVAWGVVYDFFETMMATRGLIIGLGIRTLLFLRFAPILNALTYAQMRRNPFVKWGVERGMLVFCVGSPYENFREAKRYSLKGVSDKITGDLLLLAGSQDHLVGLPFFFRQAAELTGARSFTGRIFTEKENAHTHCQMGNIPLAIQTISAWIEERAASEAAGA